VRPYCEHLQDFPVVLLRGCSQMAAIASSESSRGQTVLSYRASTGFGGLVVVTTVLLAIQAITGITAFPL
jgi:hypothetical protein